MLAAEMASSARAVGAGFLWLALAAAAVALLVTGRDPALPVFAGALLASVERERDAGGWSGFAASACLRIGDAALAAGIAWYLAEHQGTARGAATACGVLALALLASYVRVRAASLGIRAGALGRGASSERSVWLAVVAVAAWAGIPDAPEALVGGLVVAGVWSAAFAGVRAARIWRSAGHG